jgi:hypothetical protein
MSRKRRLQRRKRTPSSSITWNKDLGWPISFL